MNTQKCGRCGRSCRRTLNVCPHCPELVAETLGLTLTARQGMPMAGFPHHQLETYLRKLLKEGQRVAICHQVDDVPPGAKVNRIVTPGTAPVGANVSEAALAPQDAAGATPEAPADQYDALGQRWQAGHGISGLAREAGMAWQKLHGLLTARGFKAGKRIKPARQAPAPLPEPDIAADQVVEAPAFERQH